MNTERNLLFGMLALQNSFINRDQLIAAFDGWISDKTQSLGKVLETAGHLTQNRRLVLESLVAEHLTSHNSDPSMTLAALSSTISSYQELLRLPDPDVQACLVQASAIRKSEYADTTVSCVAVGSSTSSGTRFRVLRFHDRGGLGIVYVARDEELYREVALKEIQAIYADNPNSRARFLLEAEITGGLEHPGIVPVYGLGAHANGRPFYAMRLIKGDSLGKAIKKFHEADSPDRDASERSLGLRRLLGRFVDVCNAVEYAHSRGVIHRDLKPDNIMLGRFGETLVVDWGSAKVVGRAEPHAPESERTLRPPMVEDLAATRDGSMVGTLPFMSPEQAAGHLDQVGPASDVYSLGATLYTLLTGTLAFPDRDMDILKEKVLAGEFSPPTTAKGRVPPRLEAVCLQAMALSPEDRYASPQLLADVIERWLADEPIHAYRLEMEEKRVLAEAHPEDWKYREGLARSRTSLGIMLHALGQDRDAAETLRLAVEDFLHLVFKEPAVLSHREGFADANIHLRRALLALGKANEARDAHVAALEEYRQLAEANPKAGLFHKLEEDLTQTLGDFAPRNETAPDVRHTPPLRGVGTESDLNAQYILVRPFAQGSFGEIWLARDRVVGREILLKKSKNLSSDSSVRDNFLLREARVTAHLSHPNIATVLDIGRLTDGTYFYTMPVVDGSTLAALLSHGRADFRELVPWLSQVCQAVAFAHSKGVVHRDLKPSNILIGDFGEVVVIDWGLAKWPKDHVPRSEDDSSEDRLTDIDSTSSISSSIAPALPVSDGHLTDIESEEGRVMGTPAYMSPEQAKGAQKEVGAASDIYSLGVILYEVLTGNRPFHGDILTVLSQVAHDEPASPHSLNGRIPRPLEAICLKAMAKEPAQRYQTAQELAEDLHRWMVGDPPIGHANNLGDRLRYWCRWFGGSNR